MGRCGNVLRETAETKIAVELDLDGGGKSSISTTIPFFDHMLSLLAAHSFFNLTLQATGDTEVDYHHLVEDTGISLGQAFRSAIGNKTGIARYGSAFVPMDESLCHACIDISGRPYLILNGNFANTWVRDFNILLLKEFFKAFADHGGITLHLNLIYGTNPHHIAESMFKASAHALKQAVSLDKRIEGVLSTKGSL